MTAFVKMKPKKLGRVVLKEEFFAITGCLEEAIVINQMCYWSEKVKEMDEFLEEEYTQLVDHVPVLAHGWIYKSAAQLAGEMFGAVSEKTMNRILDRLVKKRLLHRRVNPNPKYRFDKTYHYRVNFVAIIMRLHEKGLPLSGYQIIEECVSRVDRGVAPKRHFDGSKHQVDGAIPETTSETTTKKTPIVPLEGDSEFFQNEQLGLPQGANAQGSESDDSCSRPPRSMKTVKLRSSRKSPPPKPDDVTEETWQAWCEMRKAKRASISTPVINLLRNEANKAGWSLNSAMQECVLRNWQGFKAAWLEKAYQQEKQSQGI